MTKNGILCEVDDKRVFLDPKSSDVNGINFVSHAHSDHLPSKNGGTILSSIETNEIADLRGFKMENHVESIDDFSLIDSGHILGAKGLLFDDVFYTGDVCTRDRGFLKGAKIPKCKTLITECTFGLPEFVFPKLEDTLKQVNELISELYGKGVPVILMGYQLGKAQTITQFFGHWGPLYLHDSVKDMNALHQKFGVSLNDGIGHTEAEKNGLLEKKRRGKQTYVGLTKKGEQFFQKHRPDWTPDWIDYKRLGQERKKEYVVAKEEASLVWLANLACLEIHQIHSFSELSDKPDYIVYDLDPPEDGSFDLEELKSIAFAA